MNKPTLVFVYNADSDLFSTLSGIAHKMLSPETYECNLCAITYSNFGMRKEWKGFLRELDVPCEFLHRDELEKAYGISDVPLPAIFKRQGDKLETCVDADSINACHSMEELKELITGRV